MSYLSLYFETITSDNFFDQLLRIFKDSNTIIKYILYETIIYMYLTLLPFIKVWLH